MKFDDEKLGDNYLKVTVRHALGQHHITPTLDFEQEGSFSSARMPLPNLRDNIVDKPGAGSNSPSIKTGSNMPKPSELQKKNLSLSPLDFYNIPVDYLKAFIYNANTFIYIRSVS